MRNNLTAKSKKRRSVRSEKRKNAYWRNSASGSGENESSANERRKSYANASNGRRPKQLNQYLEAAA